MSHTWPHSEYIKNYQELDTENRKKETKSKSRDNLEYTGLNFVQGIDADEFKPVYGSSFKRRAHEKPSNELSYEGLDFQGNSETKARFVRKPVDGFVKVRPKTNI